MKQVLFIICLSLGFNFATGQNLPDNPDPGKCYVKCITKDEFRDVEETIQVYPAYTTLEVVPATYRTVTEEVLVKEASKSTAMFLQLMKQLKYLTLVKKREQI